MFTRRRYKSRYRRKTRWTVLYNLLIQTTYIHPVNAVLGFAILWATSGWIKNADILVVSFILSRVLRVVGLIVFIGSIFGIIKTRLSRSEDNGY